MYTCVAFLIHLYTAGPGQRQIQVRGGVCKNVANYVDTEMTTQDRIHNYFQTHKFLNIAITYLRRHTYNMNKCARHGSGPSTSRAQARPQRKASKASI